MKRVKKVISEAEQVEFLTKLKALLEEYQVQIYFGCDPCSDTYGITGAEIVIGDMEGKKLFSADGYGLCAVDIKFKK